MLDNHRVYPGKIPSTKVFPAGVMSTRISRRSSGSGRRIAVMTFREHHEEIKSPVPGAVGIQDLFVERQQFITGSQQLQVGITSSRVQARITFGFLEKDLVFWQVA